MSREYPDFISPQRAAEGKRVFSGTVPLSRMERLSGLLAGNAGEASFSAAFGLDMDRRVVIDLKVEADLPLICQASLEAYDEPVHRQVQLVVIEDESEQRDLPDHCETVQAENGRLAIASIVEDELILGLPHVPRKPGLEAIAYSTDGKKPAEAVPGERKRKRPFAALQDMWERDKQD